MRHIQTDIGRSPQRIYERIYCLKGNAENRLKGLKAGLGLDRTNCHRFLTSKPWVLLAATFELLHELRWQARRTAYERAREPRLRDIALEIAVWPKATLRRVVLHLPRAAGATGVAEDCPPVQRGGAGRGGRLKVPREQGAADQRGRAGAVRVLDGREPVPRSDPAQSGP